MKGDDKSETLKETEGKKGYAVGFSGLLRFVMANVPTEEKYEHGIRKRLPIYPEIAVREIIANALIHQDFTVSGSSPVIEIYSNRIEVTNPGNSLIEVDRIIDERRSRNEKLAAAMRILGFCEERGGGLDKALIEIEKLHLPAFDIDSSDNSMRLTLLGPRKFNELNRAEKLQSAYFHCTIRYLKRDYMSNASLRARFSLSPKDYKAVSAIIADLIESKKIAPADPEQGNRNAKYVPAWASR